MPASHGLVSSGDYTRLRWGPSGAAWADARCTRFHVWGWCGLPGRRSWSSVLNG